MSYLPDHMNTAKTLQSGRHIFVRPHAGRIIISVRHLDNIHMLRESNKWTFIVN